MIQTARQLKDLVRNRANGNSTKAQLFMRNYAMERLLERISLSNYKDNFVLKGGMLVSAIVGLECRATMDMDTTICNLPLSPENAKATIEEIIQIPIDDNMCFTIKDASEIMEDSEYGGVRVTIEASLDNTRIPLKVDISTGDEITPAQIRYQYRLMFEERIIELWAYNIETILAEKIETVLARGTLNTRLRDFYDIYILQTVGEPIDLPTLTEAISATCRNRGSQDIVQKAMAILDEVEANSEMQGLWYRYQGKNSYAAGIRWEDAVQAVRSLWGKAMGSIWAPLA